MCRKTLKRHANIPINFPQREIEGKIPYIGVGRPNCFTFSDVLLSRSFYANYLTSCSSITNTAHRMMSTKTASMQVSYKLVASLWFGRSFVVGDSWVVFHTQNIFPILPLRISAREGSEDSICSSVPQRTRSHSKRIDTRISSRNGPTPCK